MKQSKQKTIGVLGGMGPLATVLFFQNLVELTPAKKDWEHLHIVIDNNPHIPSRTRHHLYGETSPLPMMIASCRKLARYPVDFIVIPCNSASVFLAELQKDVPVQVLNIMAITIQALKQLFPRAKKVAVLGGRIVYDKETYSPYLAAQQMQNVNFDMKTQQRIEALIERIKLNRMGKTLRMDFQNLVTHLQHQQHPDALILGCTEFGYLRKSKCALPLIDSNLELAQFAIQKALAE